MSLPNIDWAAHWRDVGECKTKARPGSEESRAFWDAKAPAFAHKQKRSGYIEQLMGLMALEPGESVLDAGCGSGTLAVPLAQAGHDVIALDFSPVMLDELRAAAEERGVRCVRGDAEDANDAPAEEAGEEAPGAKIAAYERSWQQSWDDLPLADVSVSSRSLVTEDLADAIGKLERHARKRAVISTGAGDMPIRDRRILVAMGRPEEEVNKPEQLIIIMNYLLDLGRMPRLEYIALPGWTKRDTREELVEHIRLAHRPANDEENARLDAYLDEHVAFNAEEDCWALDYQRTNSWAVITWDVPAPQD